MWGRRERERDGAVGSREKGRRREAKRCGHGKREERGYGKWGEGSIGMWEKRERKVDEGWKRRRREIQGCGRTEREQYGGKKRGRIGAVGNERWGI